ncbi:MAG: hypothetical protein IKY70_03305 [Bacteroidales bacterium]|nr:hypothetical protein [Bacteroidales bacterium]
MLRNLAYRIFTSVVLVALVAVALFDKWSYTDSEWIPLVSGFGNIDFMTNGVVSTLLGAGIVGAILFSIYLLVRRISVIEYSNVSLLFLLLIAARPSFLHFNTIYIVLLCLVWMQFCIVESQIFTAYLMLSVATLFYAPVIWLLPFLLLLIPFSGSPDSLKSFVKAIAGFITPHLYLLTFRWMKFDDAGVYLIQYWNSISDIHLLETHWSFPKLFFVVCVVYLVMRSSQYLFETSMGKLAQGILKMQILSLVMSLPLFICFNTEALPLFIIMAYPAAVLFSFYFGSYANVKRSGTEFILLLMAVIINSLSYII